MLAMLALPSGVVARPDHNDCMCLADDKDHTEHGSEVTNATSCGQSKFGPEKWCDITVHELRQPPENRVLTQQLLRYALQPKHLSQDQLRNETDQLLSLLEGLLQIHTTHTRFKRIFADYTGAIKKSYRENANSLFECIFAFSIKTTITRKNNQFTCSVDAATSWLSISYSDATFRYAFALAPLT